MRNDTCSIYDRGEAGMVRIRLGCLLLTAFLADASAYKCVYCLPGKYKSEIANNACWACPKDTYVDYAGADGQNRCNDCPANSQAPSGSSALAACMCNPGFFGPPGGPCTPCAAGRYSSNIGQSACSFCPQYSNSPAQSDQLTDCTCVVGYTGPDGVACDACAANTYKTTSGSAACTDCVVNTMTVGLGKTNIDACVCNPGFTAGGGAVNMQTYSSTACARFLTLTSKPSFATVSTRNDVGVGSAMLPTYNPTGGPNGKGHLEFRFRTFMDWNTWQTVSTPLQYFDAGPRYFNIVTNGGFTLVAVVRATESYNADKQGQTIFEAVSARNSFSLVRTPSGTGIGMFVKDLLFNEQMNIEVANVDWKQWIYIAIKLDANQRKTSMSINSVMYTNEFDPDNDANFTDSYFDTVKVGSSHQFPKQSTFDGDMAGVFFVDEVLSSSAITAITNQIKGGVDLTIMCDGGDAGGCTGCIAGKYKVDSGPAACTNCGVHTYSTALAATAATTCEGCPANTVSALGSGVLEACTCNTGYTGADGHACEACTVGQWKSTTGSAACTDCGLGKYSGLPAMKVPETCTTCPQKSFTKLTGNDVVQDCECNAGYTGPNGGHCTACVAGKYKLTPGSHECTSCPENTWSTEVGSTNGATCQECPTFSVSAEGSDTKSACLCKVGYTGEGGNAPPIPDWLKMWAKDSPMGSVMWATHYTVPCSACTTGTYKDTDGPMACTNCASNTYSTAGAAVSVETCRSCPDNMLSAPGSNALTNCNCNMGYTGADGDVCTACVPGKFKTTSGAVMCTDCPLHTYSVDVAKTDSTCTDCSSNSKTLGLGSAVATQCLCDFGYFGANGGPCMECGTGKYKDSQGTASCSFCGENFYQPFTAKTASEDCWKCPASSLSPAGSSALTSCQCSPGYFGANGETCTQCYAGRFKTQKGPQDCSLCESGKFSTALGASEAETCVACHSNTVAMAGSSVRSDCHCKAGFFTENIGEEHAECKQCKEGSYNTEQNSVACSKCGAGKYTSDIGATSGETCLTCQAGYSGEGFAQCEPCPLNSTSAPGSGNLKDCKCDPGYSGKDGETCVHCLPGKFKETHGSARCDDCVPDTYSTQFAREFNSDCLDCPMFTQAPESSDSKDDCKCWVGHTSSVPGVDGEKCNACAAGKFKGTLGHDECSLCPANKYVETTGSSAIGACMDCFRDSTSDAGSDSIDDCLCVGGYERAPD